MKCSIKVSLGVVLLFVTSSYSTCIANHPSVKLHGFQNKDMSLTHAGINCVSTNFWGNYQLIKSVDFSRNEISTLNSVLVSPLNKITTLKASFNKIKSIDGKGFENVPSLRYLSLNNNEITLLDSMSFKNLSKLEKLILHNNLLTSLGDFLKPLNSLKLLDLSYNKLTVLDDKCLYQQQNLKNLYLNGNMLQTLYSGSLLGLSGLEILDLSTNHLKSLPETIFHKSPLMRSINLSQNNLTKLPKLLFDKSNKLKYIYLRKMYISLLPSTLFHKLTSLMYIDFSYNLITNLGRNTFSKSTSLKDINLSHNRLSNISDLNSHVKNVDLSHNELSVLNNNIFKSCVNLEKIVLSQNKIRTIPEGIFQLTKQLHTVVLNNNQLTNVPQKVFNNLLHLKNVDMSSNVIVGLASTTFNGMPNLTNLDLSHNNLSEISPLLFQSNKELKSLDLHLNNLKQLPTELLAENKQLIYLDLSFNNLIVIPSYFLKWQNNLKFLNLEDNRLKTFPFLNTCRSLKYVSLKDNPYTSISSKMFDHVSKSKLLDLSGGKLRNFRLSTIYYLAFQGSLKLPSNSTIWNDNKIPINNPANLKNLKTCSRHNNIPECSLKQETCPTYYTETDFIADCSHVSYFSNNVMYSVKSDASSYNVTTNGFVIYKPDLPIHLTSTNKISCSEVYDIKISGKTAVVTAKCIDLTKIFKFLKQKDISLLKIYAKSTLLMSFQFEPIKYNIEIILYENVLIELPLFLMVRFDEINLDRNMTIQDNGVVFIQHGILSIEIRNADFKMTNPSSKLNCVPVEGNVFEKLIPFYVDDENIDINTNYFDTTDLTRFKNIKIVNIKANLVVISDEIMNSNIRINIIAREIKFSSSVLTKQYSGFPSSTTVTKKHYWLKELENYFVEVTHYKKGKLNMYAYESIELNFDRKFFSQWNLTELPEFVLTVMIACGSTMKQRGEHYDGNKMLAIGNVLLRKKPNCDISYLNSLKSKHIHTVPLATKTSYKTILEILKNDLYNGYKYYEGMKAILNMHDTATDNTYESEASLKKIQTLFSDREATLQSSILIKKRQIVYSDVIEKYSTSFKKSAIKSYELFTSSYHELNSAYDEFKIGIQAKTRIEKTKSVLETMAYLGKIYTMVGSTINLADGLKSGATKIEKIEKIESVKGRIDIVGSTIGLGKDAFDAVKDGALNQRDGALQSLSKMSVGVANIMDLIKNYPIDENFYKHINERFDTHINYFQSEMKKQSDYWQKIVDHVKNILDDNYISKVTGVAKFEGAIMETMVWARATYESVNNIVNNLYKEELAKDEIKMTETKIKKELHDIQTMSEEIKNLRTRTTKYFLKQISKAKTLEKVQESFFIVWWNKIEFVHKMVNKYCEAKVYDLLQTCTDIDYPKYNDAAFTINTKISEIFISALNDLNNIRPRPQLFKDTYIMRDNIKDKCRDKHLCPVTTLIQEKRIFFWFSDLIHDIETFDRVRMREIKVELEGVTSTREIRMFLTTPSQYNDTKKGDVIMFETLDPWACDIRYLKQNSTLDAHFSTFCKDKDEDNFYYPTPWGRYMLEIVPSNVGEKQLDLSKLSGISLTVTFGYQTK